jgi:hypothetical protein
VRVADDRANAENEQASRSYRGLRRAVGVLGVGLPAALVAGCFVFGDAPALRDSISAYYGTVMRDVLVGVLCAIACFLFQYRGYPDTRSDDIAANIAAGGALLVALCPSTTDSRALDVLHVLGASTLFLILAWFAFFQFTRTSPGKTPGPLKRRRNALYRTCGAIIVGCIVGEVIYTVLPENPTAQKLGVLFWLESLSLLAFGISWGVKGETLWADRTEAER